MTPQATARVNIIAAISAQRGLGLANQLLWHIPLDLQFFKQTTSGHPIIMGRNTFESIGRALPNRLNLVVSPSWYASGQTPEGVTVCDSLESALRTASEHIAQRTDPNLAAEIFIIGGAQLYAYALAQHYVDRVILTEIAADTPADAFFPELPAHEWQENSRTHHHDLKSQLDFDFVKYHHRATTARVTASSL